MGLNTNIYLPYSAQTRHIAFAIAKLAGLPVKDTYKDDMVEVITTTTEPTMLLIKLNNTIPAVDGECGHHTFLFLESTTNRGKLLNPRFSPFWIAIGKGLVDTFGGSMLYNDGNSLEYGAIDYFRPERDNTTEGWDNQNEFNYTAMEERLNAIQTINLSDLCL